MSVETIGVFVGKWIWVVIVPYLGWLKRQDKKKLDNTISRDGAKELIDLKLAPLEQKTDDNAKATNEKFDLVLDLIKTENEKDRVEKEKSSLQRKDNNEMLHTINTNVAVIKTEVDNLKDRLDKQQR